MALEGIRGYLQLASGLAEMSRAKAVEAASALLSLSGTATSGSVTAGALTTQVQELAEELLAAAAANRRNLVRLVRSEVESALAKASLMPVDELDRARAAVAKLSADVEELRDQVMASPAVRSIPEPGRSALEAMSGAASSMLGLAPGVGTTVTAPGYPDLLEETVVVDAILVEPMGSAGFATAPDEMMGASGPATRPSRKAVAQRAAAAKSAAATGGTAAARTATPSAKKVAKSATAATSAKKSTAKRSVGKATAKRSVGKATAKKGAAAATTGAAKKSTAKKSTAKRSTVKKSAVRKSAVTPATTATKGTAKKATTRRAPATKRTAKKTAKGIAG